MPATGTPAAPLALARKTRQGSRRIRGTLRAHGFDTVRARRAQVFCARHPPGGPSCARPLRRCWRARYGAPWHRLRPVAAPPTARGPAGAGARLARRAVPLRACTAAGARLAGRSSVRFWHPGRCFGPRPSPDRRRRPHLRKQASKGGLVPPWTPQPSAYGARQRCTPAQPGPVPHGLQPAGAGVLPAARRWHRGRCPSCGPLVRPGLACRPVPRPARPWPSSASTPLASLRAAARPAAPGV